MHDARLRLAVAATAFALSSTLPLAADQSPSLGELAQKEQERRKALTVRGKLLTEQDLPPSDARPNPATAAPASSSKVPAPEPTADSDHTRDKNEAWWRQRLGQVREDLRRSEILAGALQTHINALSSEFASLGDSHQRARIAAERQKVVAELDRVRVDAGLQKKRITEIEEEARRAGVPPGWLR